MASILYIVALSLSVIMALSLRFDGGDIVIGGAYNQSEASLIDSAMEAALSGGRKYFNGHQWCAHKHPTGFVICCEDVCGGVFAVYRFSFTLCLFFTTMALLTAGTSRFGAKVHRGFWFLKFFVLFALLISTIFIDNTIMANYRGVARYLSMLFLLMQILLLIDFGYSSNEKLIAMDEARDNDGFLGWKLVILLAAAGLYAGTLASWIVMYIQFGHSGCPAQQALISFTLIFTVFLTIISVSKYAPHGTILTSGVVGAYSSFLCYSALSSHTDSSCNPFTTNRDSGLDLLFGLLVAAIAMASTAWSATHSKDVILGKQQGSDLTATLDTGDNSAGDNEEEIGRESNWYYHIMMSACSIYMAMLLTDWSVQPAFKNGVPAIPAQREAGATGVGVSMGSFWVKIISQWVCLALYGWTLLAPYLLRESRDFGIEFDFD